MNHETLTAGLSELEDPKVPNLFWIEDPKLAVSLIAQMQPFSYGIEVGFGRFPSRVYNINPDIPWVQYEMDVSEFTIAKRKITDFGGNILLYQPVLAFCAKAPQEVIERANTIVFSNYDYRIMHPPDYRSLIPGQRVVVIYCSIGTIQKGTIGGVDYTLTCDDLLLYGYPINEMRERPLTLLKYSLPQDMTEIVLDVTA